MLLALVAGAGLPALFAVGLRALAMPGGTKAGDGATAGDGVMATAGGGPFRIIGGNPVRMVAAGLCFLIVLGAIGWGIWAIYQAGH